MKARLASAHSLTRRSLLTAAASLCACSSSGRRPSVMRAAITQTAPTMPSPHRTPHLRDVLRDAPITCAALHPGEPLLATGSMRTDSYDPAGQCVVWDLVGGGPAEVTTFEMGFGFEPRPGMVHWSPDGRRLAIAAGTNEIAVVVPGGGEPTLFAPEESRDYPVEFCWVDDRTLFAAAWNEGADRPSGGGALLPADHPPSTLRPMINHNEGVMRWLPHAAAPVAIEQPIFARGAGVVVGHNRHEVFMIDPQGARPASRVRLPVEFGASGSSRARWSPHGVHGLFAPPAVEQRYDRATGRETGGRTVLSWLDLAKPWNLGQIEVPGEVVDIRFAQDDVRVVVVSRSVRADDAHCTVFDGERKLGSFDAPLVDTKEWTFPDAGSVTWSPDGERLALWRKDSTIEIVSLQGARRMSWDAPRTFTSGGLLFSAGDRVVLMGGAGMTVFDAAGRTVSAFATSLAI